MKDIMDWMVSEGIAKNDFQASAIVNGLKLYELKDDEARKARVLLYRKWRPKTDKKNQLPTNQAFDLAIAGIDRDDVIDRQIAMEMTEEDWQNKIHEDLMNGGGW